MKFRHHHDWKLISKEHIEGIDIEIPAIKARGSSPAAFLREMAYMGQGYWSYVFKCDCGEVKVTRS